MFKRITNLLQDQYYVHENCVWCTETDLLLYCDLPGQKTDMLEGLGIASLFDIMKKLNY